MSKTKAAELSGYSVRGKSLPELVDVRTPAEIRERLQSVAGVTLADQVGWYASVREDKEACRSDQIAAAKQIDKVLGYEAPSRVEVSEKREVMVAFQAFHRVLESTGMSAAELAGMAVEVEPARIEERAGVLEEMETGASVEERMGVAGGWE